MEILFKLSIGTLLKSIYSPMLMLNNNNWQYRGNKVYLGSFEYNFSFLFLFQHWMQWSKVIFIGREVINNKGHITAKASFLHNLHISCGHPSSNKFFFSAWSKEALDQR